MKRGLSLFLMVGVYFDRLRFDALDSSVVFGTVARRLLALLSFDSSVLVSATTRDVSTLYCAAERARFEFFSRDCLGL